MVGTEEIQQRRLDLLQEAESLIGHLSDLTGKPAPEAAPGSLGQALALLTAVLVANTQLLVSEQARRRTPQVAALEREAEALRLLPGDDLPAGRPDVQLIARALRINTLLLMTLSSSGECRVEVPYAPMRPVIRADGTRVWCCSHETEHCS